MRQASPAAPRWASAMTAAEREESESVEYRLSYPSA